MVRKFVIKKSQIEEVCKKIKVDFKSYSFLSSGSHNVSYLIKTKQGKIVLRAENNPQFKNLRREYKFLKMLNGRSAPKALLFDSSKKIIPRRYIIYEFVEGNHPPRKANTDFVKTMALWYKKLHSFKIRNPGKFKSMYNRFNYYLKGYRALKGVMNNKQSEELKLLFNRCSKIFRENNEVFKGTKNLVLNHGDSTRTNVLYKKGEVKLIDWEFVRYALKEGDLVFFFYAYNLTDRQKKLFLKTYGYPTSKIANKRFQTIFLLHNLSIITWGMWRIDLLKKGKLDLGQKGTNKKDLLKMISKDMKSVNDIINKYFSD